MDLRAEQVDAHRQDQSHLDYRQGDPGQHLGGEEPRRPERGGQDPLQDPFSRYWAMATDIPVIEKFITPMATSRGSRKS